MVSPNVNPLPPLALSNGLVTIEAVNVNGSRRKQPGGLGFVLFQVANPVINGNNGAQFTVSDITTNCVLYYTMDGTDPKCHEQPGRSR